MEVWDWSQAHSCGICGGQSDNGTGLTCHKTFMILATIKNIEPVQGKSYILLTDGIQDLETFLLILKSLGSLGSWHGPKCPYAFMHDTNVFTLVKDKAHYSDKVLLWNLFVGWMYPSHTLHYHCHTHYNTVNTNANVHIPQAVKVHTSLTSSTPKFPGGYFTDTMDSTGSRDSSVTLLTRQWAGWLMNCISNPSKGKIYLYSKASRVALGPAQPTMYWVPVAISPVGKVAKMWNWPLASNTADAINDRSYIYFHSTIKRWFTTTKKKKKLQSELHTGNIYILTCTIGQSHHDSHG